MKTAAILGAGLMGSAVAWPLTDNGYEVHLIGTHLDGEIIQSSKKDRFHPRLKRKIPAKVTPYSIDYSLTIYKKNNLLGNLIMQLLCVINKKRCF
ncbi:MAG: hypothetical protein Q7J07_07600 [Pelolinea sp.]|nr:hypothetical protein [Pelolinea sp.]